VRPKATAENEARLSYFTDRDAILKCLVAFLLDNNDPVMITLALGDAPLIGLYVRSNSVPFCDVVVFVIKNSDPPSGLSRVIDVWSISSAIAFTRAILIRLTYVSPSITLPQKHTDGESE